MGTVLLLGTMSCLYSNNTIRSGYSNGSNISVKFTEPAVVDVYMLDDLDEESRIYHTSKMEPVFSSAIITNFKLDKKGYYVIKVTSANNLFLTFSNNIQK